MGFSMALRMNSGGGTVIGDAFKSDLDPTVGEHLLVYENLDVTCVK